MGFDKPPTDAELDAFYGDALTETALEIGRERVCADLELLSCFIDEATEEREPCPALSGPISTPDLISRVLFNPAATDEQLAIAARELRSRFVSAYDEMVTMHARRAMES
jgi:hypothetical protein